jgi:hypothetical protein
MLTNLKSSESELDAAISACSTYSISIHTLLSHFFRAERPPRVLDHSCRSADYILLEHDCSDRHVAEKFITQRFAERFDAHVNAFMPRLFTLRRPDGAVCAAFGLRSAQRKLFIEQYLDQPIEHCIGMHAGSRIERNSIVEVGHFSGAFPGAMRALILLLIEHLHREGFEWVTFTGTTQLNNAFRRLGLFPIDRGAAMIDAIAAEARPAWGRYYEYGPHVLAGRISEGFVALRRAHDVRVASGSAL